MTQTRPAEQEQRSAAAGRLACISYTPVKGLALVQPQEVMLGASGVEHDRRFYLVDQSRRLVAGKRLGRLVQIAPEYDHAARWLCLRFPGGERVEGTVQAGAPMVTDVWGPRHAHEVAGPWSQALSDWAGVPLQLVERAEGGSGLDRGRGGAVTILSRGSLEAMRQAAGADGEIDARRFRMLLLVDGVAPHTEDGWIRRHVAVGEAVVRPNGNVGRCAVTTQHPESGRRDFDTLRVLAAYRGDLPTTERLPFGVWGEVVRPGRARLGDPVAPLDR